ncbi:MAG: 2-C-methyl-D-erythritol 4-phosphate cytidylyltransferase [Tepidisphaeraceae bacterium]
MPDFAVILPAAGRSTRFGGSISKLLQPLAGRPVLAWTLSTFANRDDVRQIVVATTDPDAIRHCAASLENSALAKLKICPGGACRADSVRLAALACDPSIVWLAVHDAARPLVSQALIDRTFQSALAHGAAAAALAVHLTIKQAAGPLPAPVRQTLARHDLWAMQTPQAMRRQDLIDAFAACPIPLDQVTDDVQLLELAGKPVWLVDGEERNLKITTPLDLQIARALIGSQPT